MKKWVMITLFLLALPAVFANHNRFRTGINGNYLPMYSFAQDAVYNVGYPMHYGNDPASTHYNARYCGREFFGQSDFGIMVDGRCSMKYGRYGKFGIAADGSTFTTTGAAYVQPMMDVGMQEQQGLHGRGTSIYYADVPAAGQGISSRNGKQSRFYPGVH